MLIKYYYTSPLRRPLSLIFFIRSSLIWPLSYTLYVVLTMPNNSPVCVDSVHQCNLRHWSCPFLSQHSVRSYTATTLHQHSVVRPRRTPGSTLSPRSQHNWGPAVCRMWARLPGAGIPESRRTQRCSLKMASFPLPAASTKPWDQGQRPELSCPTNLRSEDEEISHFKRTQLKNTSHTLIITHYKHLGDFQVAFRLCFKASPSAKPFLWKLVLFTCKWTKICVWIKLISIWKASH